MSTLVPVKSGNNYDKDIVQLAGYYAYRSKKEGDSIKINDTIYTIRNIKEDRISGLDAFTIENYKTKEYYVIYVGTEDLADTKTNIQLLSELEPK
ncbi:hypothetical protein [Metabacillus fastidiosus]|uniref:hypothetical protein n=1 Tax=Metabacillus fastidiosus TaxID=1458 RepID=UPI003D2D7579